MDPIIPRNLLRAIQFEDECAKTKTKSEAAIKRRRETTAINSQFTPSIE
jgi:hypothetical protein